MHVVRAFEPVDLLLILEHRKRRRREGLEAVLVGEARVHRLHHVVDLEGLLRALLDVAAYRGEKVAHRRSHALGERAVLDALARSAGGFAQRLESDRLIERIRLLREYRSQRGIALHPALEQILLLLDPLHHVFDDVLVLAAQAAELRELLLDAGTARVENRAHRRGERANLGAGRRTHDVALRRDQFLRERLFELRQAAFRKQRVVAVHLGEQRLLRGDGEDLGGRDRERLRGVLHLARDFRLDLVAALELVPQTVDLVQDDQPACLGRRIDADQVVLPHVDVGARDPGIRGEDEEDRMRVGQQVERELGLRADGVQPRRIENDQPLLQ